MADGHRAGAPPAPPARAGPRAPLGASPLPARGAPNLPRRAGAGLGQGAWVTSGCDAPLRARGAGALRGFLYLAAKLPVPLAPLALVLPPPRPLLLSCLSALFSGLITFRIKAKPSPGCEYNAPPSPLGEERGAGAPRGGRGRGRARRAARRRRGGRPGGGLTTSPASAAAQVGPGRAGRPCLARSAPGSRCPERERGPGARASSKEGGGSPPPLYLHFSFPRPHPATSARGALPFWGRWVGCRVRIERRGGGPFPRVVMKLPELPGGACRPNGGHRDMFRVWREDTLPCPRSGRVLWGEWETGERAFSKHCQGEPPGPAGGSRSGLCLLSWTRTQQPDG